jgi:predicted transcriptional regulator
MQIREVMTAQVQCCTPDDSLDHAARLMWDTDCGCLPVCTVADGKAPAIGLITDRDICMCALFEGEPLSALRVRQAMTDRLLACQPGDTLEQAERVMQQGQVRRLPVLSAEGQLLGIVSLADLARTAAREGSTRIIGHDISEAEVGHTLAAICQRQAAAMGVAL